MPLSSRAIFFAFWFWVFLACASVPAHAGVVGTIHIDTYETWQSGNTAGDQSGVTMSAHYEVSDAEALSDCCDPADLRWLQLVDSNKSTGFTPTPNRPFIDPKPGQNGGDNLPWYDFTYPTSTLTNFNNGSGPYIYDRPAINNSRADELPAGDPYRFIAKTILICIYEDAVNPIQLTMLGGFEWGFSISNNGETPAIYDVNAFEIDTLNDTAGIRSAFNIALAFDFPGYQLIDCSDTACAEINFMVPEPSSLALVIVGLFILCAAYLKDKLMRHRLTRGAGQLQ